MSFMPAKPAATHDFYGPVHKGLRLAQTRMLVRLGACDGQDAQRLAELIADLRTLLHLAEHHLANEDASVHTALEARAPGATSRLVESHEHHRDAFAALEALTVQVEAADAIDRPRLMQRLYLRFTTFMAEDLVHMAEEETLILPILQSLFTDEELRDIEDRILAALSPEELVSFGRLMIPAATRRDRIALCSALRANAPAEAFGMILDATARTTLDGPDFAHLCEGLGLAA